MTDLQIGDEKSQEAGLSIGLVGNTLQKTQPENKIRIWTCFR